MTRENLFEALGNADAAYISEAYGVKQKSPKKRRRVIAVAAAVAVLAAGGAAVLVRPSLLFNGVEEDLGINIKYDAKIPTAEELYALGGVNPPDGGWYEFESVAPNALFSAMNVSPLRSSRVDYDSPMYVEAGGSYEYGTSDVSYIAVDSVTGKKFKAGISWVNTRKGLEMNDGVVLYMKSYETYTLPCGAEAKISLPDPDVPQDVERRLPSEEIFEGREPTDEELTWAAHNLPDALTWIWFVYDDMKYFIRAEHTAEEAKALLDSFG